MEKKASIKEVLYPKPSDVEQRILYERIHLNQDKLQKAVEDIKKWILTQPHLPQLLGTEDILPFVVWSKGDLPAAKIRLDAFYTVRNYELELFEPRDPTAVDFMDSYSCSSVFILPRLCPDGLAVLVALPTTPTIDQFSVEGLVRRLTLVLEAGLRARPLTAGGFAVILDQKHTSYRHVGKLTPSVVQTCLRLLQEVYPIRLKLIVIINVHSVVRIVLQTLIIPFLKSKIKNRLHLYSGGCENLLNHFPKEVLPSDFGGDEKPLQELDEMTRDYLIIRRDQILKENTLKTDETLRIGDCPWKNSKYCSVM